MKAFVAVGNGGGLFYFQKINITQEAQYVVCLTVVFNFEGDCRHGSFQEMEKWFYLYYSLGKGQEQEGKGISAFGAEMGGAVAVEMVAAGWRVKRLFRECCEQGLKPPFAEG